MTVAGIGLLYTLRLGRFLIEPTLLAAGVHLGSMESTLRLKQLSATMYRKIIHRTGQSLAMTLLPELTLRVPIRE